MEDSRHELNNLANHFFEPTHMPKLRLDEWFFVFLAHFKYYMKIEDWHEAKCSLSDLRCYDTGDDRVRFHVEEVLKEYGWNK